MVLLLFFSIVISPFLISPVYAASDLGCNLVTDTLPRDKSVLPAKPGYLESYMDRYYGSKITRVSGDPGTAINSAGGKNMGTWSTVTRHEYSKQQPWNADMSVIFLNWNGLFLDGTTYRVLDNYYKPARNDIRWHPTDPALMVYTYGNTLSTWNPKTQARTILHTFAGAATVTIGEGEGNITNDGKLVLILDTPNKKGWVYNFVTQTASPAIDFSALPSIDNATLSSRGEYILANDSSDHDHTYSYNATTGQATKIQSWPEWACPSHFDVLTDEQENEVVAGICKLNTTAKYIKRLFAGGVKTGIAPTFISHTSTRNIFRPHYAYGSNPYGDGLDGGKDIYTNEVLAVKTDGTRVERLAWIPNRWIEGDYPTEPHAAASPDGKKVFIASNWNDPSGRPVQSYIIEVCPGSAGTTGDADGDGDADADDFSIWKTEYGKSGRADFDKNGTVDGKDYMIWANAYGK